MGNSSAERLESSSQIECKPLVHLCCSSMILLAMKFVLIFIRVLWARHLKQTFYSCWSIKSLQRHFIQGRGRLIGESPNYSSCGGRVSGGIESVWFFGLEKRGLRGRVTFFR